MDDLISRQAAIDAATYGNPQTAWQRIEALPSAQPEPRWIPVTERLPERFGSYLVTTRGIMRNGTNGTYRCVEIVYWNPVEKVWVQADFTEVVIAWLPLPEPYKEGEECR